MLGAVATSTAGQRISSQRSALFKPLMLMSKLCMSAAFNQMGFGWCPCVSVGMAWLRTLFNDCRCLEAAACQEGGAASHLVAASAVCPVQMGCVAEGSCTAQCLISMLSPAGLG